MIEYHIRFAVGKPDGTWYEAEQTVLNHDEGDARAIEMGEAQLKNVFDKANLPVVFIAFLSLDIVEDEEDDESNGSNWLAYGKWLDEEELDDYEDYDDEE